MRTNCHNTFDVEIFALSWMVEALNVVLRKNIFSARDCHILMWPEDTILRLYAGYLCLNAAIGPNIWYVSKKIFASVCHHNLLRSDTTAFDMFHNSHL